MSGGVQAFKERQRARIQAYWDSPRSKAHKRAMRDKPIRLGKTRPTADTPQDGPA